MLLNNFQQNDAVMRYNSEFSLPRPPQEKIQYIRSIRF